MNRILFVLTIGTVTTSIWLFGSVYAWAWVPINFALTTTAAVLLLHLAKQGKTIPWSLPTLAALGFGILVLFQCFFGQTRVKGETLTGLIQLGGCAACLILSLALFSNPRRINQWRRIAIALVIALSVESLLQHFFSPGAIYWFHDASYATPTGPFVYHNHFAACIELLLPFPLLELRPTNRSISFSELARKAAPSLLGVCALVLSESRLGLLIGLFEIATITFLLTGADSTARSRKALISLGALILAVAVVGNWGPVLARYMQFAHHDPSLTVRLGFYRVALSMWASAPLHGVGFGNFGSLFPHYAITDTLNQTTYAHSDYLQTLAETGVVGALFSLLFLAGIIRAATRIWPRRSQPAARVQLAAAVGALGMAAHAIGDFPFRAPANAYLFFLVAGLVLAPLTKIRQRAKTAHSSSRASLTRPWVTTTGSEFNTKDDL